MTVVESVSQTVWAVQMVLLTKLWKPVAQVQTTSAVAEPVEASVEAASQTVWAVQEVPSTKLWKPVLQAQVASALAVPGEVSVESASQTVWPPHAPNEFVAEYSAPVHASQLSAFAPSKV
jgi:hypothetical protein